MGETMITADKKLENELIALREIHILSMTKLNDKYNNKLAYKYEKNSNFEDKALDLITKLKK